MQPPAVPDAALLADCPEPGSAGISTNGDILAYIQALLGALRGCNADKAALRQFYEDLK